MKHIEVVAAIIIFNNKILCMQRKESKYDYISKKFEFPGGKVELSESLEKALMRELKEEMEIDVKVNREDFFMTITHEYPDFFLTMHSFLIFVENDYFVMNEHISFKWLDKKDLLTLDWAMADLPIVNRIIEVL